MRNLLLVFCLFFSLNLIAQDLSALYEKVKPAVVVIYTEGQELVNIGGKSGQVKSGGLGSGFMISDSTLMTAAHVVQVAEKVQVQFEDGEVLPGRVISALDGSDVALVQLIYPRENATVVKLGDSDRMKVGNQIFVVGAPFGLAHSLSSGYISGIKKEGSPESPFSYSEFLQTDAAINTGNSGGPVFNFNGEVVGIASKILTKSGGFEGIGFAATSNVAKALLLERKILWSGIEVMPLTGKMAKLFNVPQPNGLLVLQVVDLSPLDILGVKGGDIKAVIEGQEMIIGGDIILSVNGVTFDIKESSLVKLNNAIANLDPEEFYLKVLRGGQVLTLSKY